MSFTWEEIDQDWFRGEQLAIPRDEVLESFNRVANTFGRDWVEASRIQDQTVVRGTSPTLRVVMLGQRLVSLGNPPGAGRLLGKMQNGSSDALAELSAIHMVRSGVDNVDLELEPAVTVKGRSRLSDFRVRRENQDWLYVEVTQPGTSDGQVDVRQGLKRLAGLAADCGGSFTLEVFLLREPTIEEVEAIASEILSRHSAAGTGETNLPDDLGTLYWNRGQPGEVTVEDHDAPYTPRLGMALLAERNGNRRHISVRWPFTDDRAAKFIQLEAAQLPTDAPGLIMIQTANAVGAMHAWEPLIQRRFQPTINTRISAVCLYTSNQRATSSGTTWTLEAKLIINPHARFALPAWVADQLLRFSLTERDLG